MDNQPLKRSSEGAEQEFVLNRGLATNTLLKDYLYLERRERAKIHATLLHSSNKHIPPVLIACPPSLSSLAHKDGTVKEGFTSAHDELLRKTRKTESPTNASFPIVSILETPSSFSCA